MTDEEYNEAKEIINWLRRYDFIYHPERLELEKANRDFENRKFEEEQKVKYRKEHKINPFAIF